MSSCDRRTLLLALAALPACGFTPVYAPGTQAGDLRGAVRLGEPDSTNAFALVRELELRLGVVETPRYDLRVNVDLTEQGSVIARTAEIERFSINGRATYDLSTTEGAPVARGIARGFTSYSASGTPMSTRAARDDAQDRLMVILADQVVTRLVASLP